MSAVIVALAALELAPHPKMKSHARLSYAQPVFGICVRGSVCRAGEVWLDPPSKSDRVVRATRHSWRAPSSLDFKELEKHYTQLIRAKGWRLMGVTFDEDTQRLALSAMKFTMVQKLKGGDHPALRKQPDYAAPANAVEIVVTTTGLDGSEERGRRIELYEGVGRAWVRAN